MAETPRTLLGRDRELEAVVKLVARPPDGTDRGVLVDGPVGVGRTAFLEEVTHYARSTGQRLLVAGPGSRHEFARPVDKDPPGGNDRVHIVIGDDIATASDMHAVQRLGHELGGTVTFVVARRPEARTNPELNKVIRRLDLRTIELGALDRPHTQHLAASLLGAQPGPQLAALLQRGSGGNPRLLEHMLADLQSAGQITPSDGTTVEVGEVEVDGLDGALAAARGMLNELGATTRRTLEVVAIAEPVRVDHIADVVGVRVTDLLPHIEEATRSGVLAARDGEIVTVNDCLRAAVLATLRPPTRGAAEREDGPAIGRPSAPEDHVGSELAPILDRLVGVLPGLSGEFVAIMTESVRLHASVGEHDFADELGTSALRIAAPVPARATLLLELADLDFRHGHLERSARRVTRALTMARPRSKLRHSLLELQAKLALVRAPMTNESRSREPVGPERHVAAWPPEGRIETSPRQRLWFGVARSLVAADRLAEALRLLLSMERDVSLSQPDSGVHALWRYYVAKIRYIEGRLTEAGTLASAGLESSGPVPNEVVVLLRSLLAQTQLKRGAIAEAQAELARAGCLARRSDRVAWLNLLSARARLHDALHAGEDAAADRAELIHHCAENPVLLFSLADQHTLVPEFAHHVTDESTDALEILRGVLRHLRRMNPNISSLAGCSDHVDGLVLQDPERLASAIRRLEKAGRPLALHDVRRDEAALLARTDNTREAPSQSAPAMAKARDPVLADDRTSQDPRGGAGQSPAQRGWENLTDAEMRVVTVVARGLTNKETARRLHLSPYTVDSHLRRIFEKLGIRSRVELARQLSARAFVAPNMTPSTGGP